MSSRLRVAVVGATGFVGTATVRALVAEEHNVLPVAAPRLPDLTEADARGFIESRPRELMRLIDQFRTAHAVVNAAGIAAATSSNEKSLVAANGVLPGLLGAAARSADVPRFVHVSSAAVQGRRPMLDESNSFEAFSAYSRSKVLGELLAQEFYSGRATVYRPPGVHGADRGVTRFSARIAASPLSSVARPADSPSPQAHISNVAAAISYLATCEEEPPPTVIHPWEGLSTADVLRLLGGRTPIVVPRTLARAVVSIGAGLGRRLPWLAGNTRRLEMMWFGQPQSDSWLTHRNWSPPYGNEAWAELGRLARSGSNHRRKKGADG